MSTYLCILCEEELIDKSALTAHLLSLHHLVISNIDGVADLSAYLLYWRQRLQHTPLDSVAAVIKSQAAKENRLLMILQQRITIIVLFTSLLLLKITILSLKAKTLLLQRNKNNE